MIEDTYADPFKRPHQLFMSGDQIYADDMPLALLPQLIDQANELLGNAEFLPPFWSAPFLGELAGGMEAP